MNIKKYIGKTLLTVMLPAMGVAGFTACSDWNDHYEGDATSGSDISLWDAIQQRSDLSDFAEVLENTMVFRQHRKTSVSYADVLKGGRSLTLLAPVNGTFNKDSLLNLVQTAQGDSAVEQFFIKNHLSQKLISSNGSDQRFRLLNEKNVSLAGGKVGSVEIKESNVHTKNGIMHVLTKQMPYMYTIYEAFVHMPEFKSNGEFLASYNEDYFDEESSVVSGIVDGNKVYADSVIREQNRLMWEIGELNAEDSTYYVTVPTEAGWKKAWDKAKKAFVFPESNPKADSLSNLWTYRALMREGVFTNSIQPSLQDSVVSSWYDKNYPQYCVYYKPFAADGIFGRAKEAVNCSNGVIYASDEWVHDPKRVYHKKIEVEGEQTWLYTSKKECDLIVYEILADSVSKGKYVHVKNLKGSTDWELTYKISGTVSSTYDVKMIALPKSVTGTSTKKPFRFVAQINYIDVDGKQKTFNCNNGNPINTDPAHVDSILLARFKFPATNYGESTGQATITIKSKIKSNENTKYDRNLYLDAFVLEPVDDEEE